MSQSPGYSLGPGSLGAINNPLWGQMITSLAQGLRIERLLTVGGNGLIGINEW